MKSIKSISNGEYRVEMFQDENMLYSVYETINVKTYCRFIGPDLLWCLRVFDLFTNNEV